MRILLLASSFIDRQGGKEVQFLHVLAISLLIVKLVCNHHTDDAGLGADDLGMGGVMR